MADGTIEQREEVFASCCRAFRPSLRTILSPLLAELVRNGLECVFGLELRAQLLSLLFSRRVLAQLEQFSCFVAAFSGICEAQLRVGPDSQCLLVTLETVFEAPWLSA